MEYAPIVVFAFNRLEALKACVDSLLNNTEAGESNLIVYVDGPRINRAGEEEKVRAVREYVKSIKGFKSLTYHFSDINKGLATSIIDGVSQVMMQYGRAIVLEDDLICSSNFLAFVNQGLEKYESEKEVFSVSGFSHPIKLKADYHYHSYFAPRSGSWGWATWKDRWQTVDWHLDDWEKVERNKRQFNKWGGSDCYSLLKRWKRGRNNSWAIRFDYAQFVQKKTSLFPVVSKISNQGFTTGGTHCKDDNVHRYKMVMDQGGPKRFNLPDRIEEIDYIRKQRLWPNSLYVRIVSKIKRLI